MAEPPSCCHSSHDEHIAEVALLAALLVEHDLLAAILVDPSTTGPWTAALIDAHSAAAVALAAWTAFGPLP